MKQTQCTCCGRTEAERLVDLARRVKHSLDRLTLCENIGSSNLATIALAFKLEKNVALTFQAIVEGWDRLRIVRELH